MPRTPTAPASTSTVIERVPSYPDPTLAAKGLGRLEFALRSMERPTQALDAGLVIIRRSANEPERRATTDREGVARFDSLPVGIYQVSANRLGYNSRSLSVPVRPGCRTDAEVYLAVTMIGIAPPPPQSGRATVTVCGP